MSPEFCSWIAMAAVVSALTAAAVLDLVLRGVSRNHRCNMAKAKPKKQDDSDLDACEQQLAGLQDQLAPKLAAGEGSGENGSTGFDPASILAIIEVVSKIIAAIRKRRGG